MWSVRIEWKLPVEAALLPMQHQPVTHGHCNNSIDRRFEPFEVLIHLRLGGSTSDRRAAPRPHYADLTTAPLAARTPTGRFKDRRPGLSVSDRPGTRVSGRRLSAYFRRQYAPTPIDRHSDLRRPAFKQQFRRPVFCSCRTTSVEHFASTATALWQSRTV